MILRLLREGLGSLIILACRLTLPKPVERPAEEQLKVDQACSQLSLYQFRACPFCTKTRRQILRLNLPIELRDAQHDTEVRAELMQQGGKIQVPCLRIEDDKQIHWLYESDAIIAYLKQQFEIDAIGQAKTP